MFDWTLLLTKHAQGHFSALRTFALFTYFYLSTILNERLFTVLIMEHFISAFV